MTEISPNGYETMWEKEKLLVTRNFSFSHSVFKTSMGDTGLFGKGLNGRMGDKNKAENRFLIKDLSLD